LKSADASFESQDCRTNSGDQSAFRRNDGSDYGTDRGAINEKRESTTNRSLLLPKLILEKSQQRRGGAYGSVFCIFEPQGAVREVRDLWQDGLPGVRGPGLYLT